MLSVNMAKKLLGSKRSVNDESGFKDSSIIQALTDQKCILQELNPQKNATLEKCGSSIGEKPQMIDSRFNSLSGAKYNPEAPFDNLKKYDTV